MRVVMLTWEYPPRSIGGLAEHVFHLSRDLARLGLDVAVITAGLPESSPAAVEAGVSVYRTVGCGPSAPDFLSWVHELNLELAARAIEILLPAVCPKGRRGLRRSRPLLLHAHDWLVMPASRALKRLFRLPLVATVHATEAGRHGGVHTAEQKYIHDCEWALTYDAWRVICCSRFMASELERQLAVPRDKLRIIANGVDPDSLVPSTGGKRELFALPEERIVLFLGRLVPEKGAQLLLMAAPRVIASCPNTKLVIAGSGPHREALERLASELGVADRVCFAGYVDDDTRRSLYRWADAAVVPSLYEPFGIVALEAMAAGTPVVVSSVGGLGETVVDGVDGLLVPPGSAVALGEAVIRVLTDTRLRTRLLAGGAATAARHTWAGVAEATRAVYEEAGADRGLGEWAVQSCPANRNPEPAPVGGGGGR